MSKVSVQKFAGLLAVSVAALVGCGEKSDTATTAPTETGGSTNTSGLTVLRVATEGAYPPFNYTNNDGTLAGFDVDIANAICQEMKVTCDIKAQDWDGIIPSLKAGKYDAIVAGMGITPERQEQIDFSQPYYSSPLAFVAKKGVDFDPTQAGSIEGKNIGVQRATLSSQWLEANHPKANIKQYGTADEAFLDLTSGRLDAILSEKFGVVTWLNTKDGESFEIKGPDINNNDDIGIAIDKGRPELLADINAAIDALKANGEYDKIVEKHFPSVK